MPYGNAFAESPIIAVDTNGAKGPNTFSFEVIELYTEGTADAMAYYPGGCDYHEKGGHSTDYYVYH